MQVRVALKTRVWSPGIDSVNLGFDETSTFTFSVQVGDVPSGTVINNDTYLVVSPEDIQCR